MSRVWPRRTWHGPQAVSRRQAARDCRGYQAADAIRGQLQAAGIAVEDTPQEPRWEIKR
jgi:cysteinyl-tRNA synthetase